MASTTYNCTRMTLGKVPIYIRAQGKSGSPNILVMKSGNGVQKNLKFKYFRVLVYATDGATTIQFTKLKFTNSAGQAFSYWTGTEQKSTIKDFVSGSINKGTPGANGGEAVEYGLLTDPTEGKCCIVDANPSASAPFIMTYELLDKTINIGTYSNWSWYTANDSTTWRGRNMISFELQVSRDGEEWFTVDKNEDSSQVTTTANWSLAYQHALDLSNL